MDKATFRQKFDNGDNNGHKNNSKYNVKAIRDSAIYAKESERGQLLGLYYLVL